jgi:hypothetical protein
MLDGRSGMPGKPDFGLEKSESGVYLPNAGMGPKNYIQGPNVGLLMNEAGDKLWGYSVPLGKWTGLTIPKTDKRPQPTVGADIGLFTADDRIYAFSSKTGRWDTVKTNRRMTVNVYPQQALFEDQGTIHIFSNVTGRWSSSGDPADAAGDNRQDMKAGDEPSPHLFDAQGRRIVIGRLDRDGDLDVLVPETSERVSATELLESLKARSAEADRDVVQRAMEFRVGAPDQDGLARLRARLEHSVGEAFDRRQQAQRLEAEILRVKLQRVDARLLEREQSKGAIISRRVKELIESPAAVPPAPVDASEKPDQTGRRAGKTNRRGNAANPDVYPAYVARGTGTRTVGVVSEVDSEGRILLSPAEPDGIHLGDELVVSRLDFVHEDGTQQFYTFSRLFVVQADADSAVARIIEIARTLGDNKAGYVNEPIEAGQIVGTVIEKPGAKPVHSELAPLQGRWRMDRWVDDGRVLPPGDLKGSRHLLLVNGDWFTLIDPKAEQILKRFRYQTRQSLGDKNAVVFSTQDAATNALLGVFEQDGVTLRISLRTGPNWGGELEPGADRIYWEFTRDDTRPGEPSEKRE